VGGEQAARFALYTSAEVLKRKTPGFWEGYVRPRIDLDFLGCISISTIRIPPGPIRTCSRSTKHGAP